MITSNKKFTNKNVITLHLFLPFTLEQYHFWVILISSIFICWLLYGEFRLWWIRDLPKKDEDLLKRKGAFWVLLFRIRTYPFKDLLEVYMEKLYEAFLVLIMFLLYFYHLRAHAFVKRYSSDYGYRRDIHNNIKLFFKRIFFRLKKIIRIFIRIFLRLWYLFIHRSLVYIYVYLSSLVEFMEVVVRKLLYFFNLLFYLLPVYVYLISFCFIISFLWFFLHKFFLFLFNGLLGILGLSFSRPSIAVNVSKIKSVDDFYHEGVNTLPIYIRLRTLVGSQIQNFWNLEQTKSILVSRKRLQYRRTVKGHDYDYMRPFLKYNNHPDMHLYPFFFNRLFEIDGVPRPFLQFYGKYNSQIILPKILTNKLDSKTFLANNLLIKSRIRPIVGSKRPFKNKIFESSSNSLVLNSSSLQRNFNVPNSSFFCKKLFFQSSNFQTSFIDSYNYYKRVADQRFVFNYQNLFPASGLVKRYNPSSFTQTNLNVLFNNDDNIENSAFLIRKNIFSNVFLTSNYLYDSMRFSSRRYGKKFLKFPLPESRKVRNPSDKILKSPLYKSRKIIGNLSARLEFLIFKKNLKTIRNRVFSAYPFFNAGPFWSPASLALRRRSFLLKTIFLGLRRTHVGDLRRIQSRNSYKSKIFNKFFYYFLSKQKISYNFSKNLTTFFRQSYSYNYKLLTSKGLKSFNNFIPLSSLNNYPWWSVYSNLIESNQINLYSDSFDREFKKNKNYFSMNLAGYGLGYCLSRSVSGERFVILNGDYARFKYGIADIFYRRKRKKIYVPETIFLRKLLCKKSYEVRFFFDSKLYYNEHDTRRVVKLDNNYLVNNIYGTLVTRNTTRRGGFLLFNFFFATFLIFLFEPIVTFLIFN